MNKLINYTFKLISGLFLLIALLVLFSFVPFPGNYKVFTVQSGSMEPAIKTGSLIFVKPAESYAVNDVITRRTIDPKVTVTHRIIEQTTQGNGEVLFKTKGDANNAEDSEFVSQDSIIGKTLFSIPYLGYPVGFAKTQQGLILLIIIPAVIIIHEEIQKIVAAIKKSKNNNDSTQSNEVV